jgi:hypothetical protein
LEKLCPLWCLSAIQPRVYACCCVPFGLGVPLRFCFGVCKPHYDLPTTKVFECCCVPFGLGLPSLGILLPLVLQNTSCFAHCGVGVRIKPRVLERCCMPFGLGLPSTSLLPFAYAKYIVICPLRCLSVHKTNVFLIIVVSPLG